MDQAKHSGPLLSLLHEGALFAYPERSTEVGWTIIDRTERIIEPIEPNFERSFTPRTSLRSPRNFGNVRFRRFANFDFSTPIFFFLKKKSNLFFDFSLFWVDFRGARLFLTSKSSSSRFFASDGQIFRSVRRLEVIFGFFTVRTSTCEGN